MAHSSCCELRYKLFRKTQNCSLNDFHFCSSGVCSLCKDAPTAAASHTDSDVMSGSSEKIKTCI